MLNSKTAIITGSASGIGAGIAKALTQAGCNIVLNGSRKPDQVKDVRSGLETDYGISARYDQTRWNREKEEDINFTAQMYLDCHPPIAGGREIWGFPKKLGHPKLEIKHDTLRGVLEYAGVTVAMATMAYKHENLICPDSGRPISCDANGIVHKMQKTQVNLKIILDVDGSLKIVQLVAYNLEHITVKSAWEGPARLALLPHVNAPVADLPVKKVISGSHFIADLTLPYGRVLYDYKK